MAPLPEHVLALLPDRARGPVAIADGFTLLSQSIEGGAAGPICVSASVFGREIVLRAASFAASGGEGACVVFEGAMAEPLLNLGSLAALSLPRVALRAARGAATPGGSEPASFAVEGRGRLEIQGLAGLDAGPLVLEGDLTTETGGASGGAYLRLHFKESRVTARAAGGATITLSFKHLYFIWSEPSGLAVEMTAGLAIGGLPPLIQAALPSEVLVDVELTERGLRVTAGSVFDSIVIPLPAIVPLGGREPLELGEIRLSASNLSITAGRCLTCAVDLRVDAPPVLRAFIEPRFDLRLTADAEDVEVRLLSSPLRAVTFAPRAGGLVDASVDLGPYGRASFVVPSLRVNWATKSLEMEGRLRYRDLQIPLGALRSRLKERGAGSIADRLPASIVLRPGGLAGAASMLADFIEDALGRGMLGERAKDELLALARRADRLPARLRESFLTVNLPPELIFQIGITPDLGARIAVSPPSAESEPVKVLLPILGADGPELLGLSLRSFAVSAILGGRLFAIEVDAEVDRFPLLPIALAATLSGGGLFPPPDELEQRILCRDLFALVVPGASGAALIPLFFKQIGVVYAGISDLKVDARWSLPAPELNFAAVLRAVSGLSHFFAEPAASAALIDWPPELRLALTVGPSYVRLPRYLGGRTFGSTEPSPPIEASLSVARALLAARDIDINGLIAAIPEGFGEREIDVELGSSFRKAQRVWSTVFSPAVHAASHVVLSPEGAPPKAPKSGGLSGKLSALRGHLAQGISALSGDTDTSAFHARVVGVSTEGIRLRASLPRHHGGEARETEIELRWDDPLGPLASLVGDLSG